MVSTSRQLSAHQDSALHFHICPNRYQILEQGLEGHGINIKINQQPKKRDTDTNTRSRHGQIGDTAQKKI